MIEVHDNVFICNQETVDDFVAEFNDGVVVYCAKDPWHRQELGYTGRGAPKTHPEYLVAVRDDSLILNLVDAAKPEWIPRDCFDAALLFFQEHYMANDKPIAFVCNQGKSRSWGVALYCLASCEIDDYNCLGLEVALDTMAEYSSQDESELGDGVRGALTEWLNE